MSITIKTSEELAKMRVAGQLTKQVLDMITPHVAPGITTGELDQICHRYIVDDLGAIPAPLNYRGFPKSICTSVNHVVCHGIPGKRKLKSGDIINIDVTEIKDGYHGDASRMFAIGDVSIRAQRLINITRECLERAIRLVRPGTRLGDIGADGDCPAAAFLNLGNHGAGILGLRVIRKVDRHICAFACKRARHLFSNSAACARDQCGFVLQFAHGDLSNVYCWPELKSFSASAWKRS